MDPTVGLHRLGVDKDSWYKNWSRTEVEKNVKINILFDEAFNYIKTTVKVLALKNKIKYNRIKKVTY